MILSAFFSLPSPLEMENSGPPPVEKSMEKAMMIEVIGRVRPMPVSASVDASGKRPIYIRSTILYKTLINWAKVMGNAILIIFFAILP